MSSFTYETIKCPNCQQEGTYMVWQSINVDLNPDQKQRVMDGSIFSWQCPHCGKQYNVLYPFLYHDMTEVNSREVFQSSRCKDTAFFSIRKSCSEC